MSHWWGLLCRWVQPFTHACTHTHTQAKSEKQGLFVSGTWAGKKTRGKNKQRQDKPPHYPPPPPPHIHTHHHHHHQIHHHHHHHSTLTGSGVPDSSRSLTVRGKPEDSWGLCTSEGYCVTAALPAGKPGSQLSVLTPTDKTHTRTVQNHKNPLVSSYSIPYNARNSRTHYVLTERHQFSVFFQWSFPVHSYHCKMFFNILTHNHN